MYTVRYGGKEGKALRLAVDEELVAVRTHSRNLASDTAAAGAALSAGARDILDTLEPIIQFADSGVEVLRFPRTRRSADARGEARATLEQEPDIAFAGRVLVDSASRVPVLYTENFFVKFQDGVRETRVRSVLREHGLTVKRELDYATNAYFVEAPEGTGREIFEIAERLLGHELVELCHPEIVRELQRRAAFPQQWHLKRTTVNGRDIDAHAAVEAAWALSEGQGITIAVIDDGVDTDHAEFMVAGKVIAPRDVTRRTNDALPGSGDDHGTACAGVACASGTNGAAGVAPAARLMPIRFVSALGSQAEADAFVWAAQNGADVISCSWGPTDGRWNDPNDPRHRQVVPLPDSTRLAIEFAIRNGRGGKGCVITWAAGNGNESVDNDGYAAYGKVIAVAACSDRGRRSVYSDFGDAVWCSFPSNDFAAPLTPGIWTTDRRGAAGYNPGQTSRGDAAGNYTNSFGGTSSSCPGAAGVAALVLGRNPELRWDEVRDILRRACDRIDTAGGAYDANGHSKLYGYGRLNAHTAVTLAAPAVASAAAYTAIHRAVQSVPIEDMQTSSLALAVGDTKPVKTVKVTVDLEHTYRGDLIVSVLPPGATGIGPIVLLNRSGGAAQDVRQTFDEPNTPGLAQLRGKAPTGTWTLEVADRAKRDTGRIVSWGVELGL